MKMTTVIECCCWCYENASAALGDRWVPIAFDLQQVATIKLIDTDGHFANGMASMYLINGENFTTNIPYEEMVARWKDYKTNNVNAYLQ